MNPGNTTTRQKENPTRGDPVGVGLIGLYYAVFFEFFYKSITAGEFLKACDTLGDFLPALAGGRGGCLPLLRRLDCFGFFDFVSSHYIKLLFIIFETVARSLGVFVFELLQTLPRVQGQPTSAQVRRAFFGSVPRVSAQARRLHHSNLLLFDFLTLP